VATTRPISNSNTTSKSQGQISSRKHKLYNSQENLTGNHNSILPTIYISVLSLCYDFSMPTLISILYPHIHYSSASCLITYPPCIYLKANMLYTCDLTSYPKPYSSSPSSICVLCIYHEKTIFFDVTPSLNSSQSF